MNTANDQHLPRHTRTNFVSNKGLGREMQIGNGSTQAIQVESVKDRTVIQTFEISIIIFVDLILPPYKTVHFQFSTFTLLRADLKFQSWTTINILIFGRNK